MQCQIQSLQQQHSISLGPLLWPLHGVTRVPATAVLGSSQLHRNSGKCCRCVKFALHNKHFIQKKQAKNKLDADADYGMKFLIHPCIILNFLQSVITTWQTCELVTWQQPPSLSIYGLENDVGQETFKKRASFR